MLGEFISRQRYAELLRRGHCQAEPWLRFDPDILKACYNRNPFLFEHALATHPFFSLEALFALCRRMGPKQIHYRIGVIPGDSHFDSSYDCYRRDLALEDVLDNFEENRAYICIYNPELDAAYKPQIEELLAEIAVQIDPLETGITWYSTYVFISTQDSVTPYHMDREMNFLIQVRGGKTAYLWDPADEDIMTAAQKDLLLARTGDRPPYAPSIESKAMTFELRPGIGVHHPFIAPHRVHTGAELSITLAFTFRTARSDVWTDAHHLNAKMRRLGLRPGAVGRNALVDRTKAGLVRLGRNARSALSGVGKETPLR
ncbi:MAG: hypothetical protein WBW61_03005 [Rhodanobacteraceae bacterium]